MFSLSTLIITALVCGLSGCALGALLTRSSQPQQQSRDLEQRLQQAEDKLGDYQKEVSDHFAQTSQLVNGLTQSYKDVHEYLANSALKLTDPAISQRMLEAAQGNLNEGEELVINEDNVEIPRDWAPKAPGQTGGLSEEYGLKEEHEEDEKSTAQAS
mgnify:FL=1